MHNDCADTLCFGYPNQVGSDTMTTSVRDDIYLGKYLAVIGLSWSRTDQLIKPSQAQNQ
jgi:hypothetical protein